MIMTWLVLGRSDGQSAVMTTNEAPHRPHFTKGISQGTSFR
jgi:hypothetical protein